MPFYLDRGKTAFVNKNEAIKVSLDVTKMYSESPCYGEHRFPGAHLSIC